MGLMDWVKKDKDPAVDDGTKAEDVTTNEGDDKSQQTPDVVGGVPVKLSEKLAEIRGQEEKDFEMVEVDDDGKIKKDEDGNPIVVADASDEEIAEAKDGETSSGDANDSLSASEEDKSVAEANTDTSGDKVITLDSRLEEAGKRMDWSEEKIQSIARADMSILEDLANQFEKLDPHRQEVKSKEGTQESDLGLSDEAVAKLKEKFGDDVAGIIIGMKKENAELRTSLKDVNEYTAKTKADIVNQALARQYEVASELFDNNSEAFPEFGKTDTLPKDTKGAVVKDSPQMKARDLVYTRAEMFHKADGGTFSSALSEALTWYSGKTGKASAHRDVVRDLNANKKRFSPKPSSRKMVKVFKTTDSKKANIVAEAKRKAGIT